MTNLQVVSERNATNKFTRIQGKDTAPNYNGKGKIDLKNFTQHNVDIPEGCEFCYWMLLDVNDMDYSANTLNSQIRDTSDPEKTQQHIEALANSFQKHGWVQSEKVPTIYETGEIDNGRHRISAVQKIGYDKIVVAVIRKIDGTKPTQKDLKVNGAKANMNSLPVMQQTKKDFIAQGVGLVKSGHIENEMSAIEHFVRQELKLEDYYPRNPAIVSEIEGKIFEESNVQGNLVDIFGPTKYKQWLKDRLGIEVDNKRVRLVATNNDTYPLREWERILEATNKGNAPIEIILHTKTSNGDKAREEMFKFEETLERLYSTSIKMTTSTIKEMTGMSINLPKSDYRPWKILGCIPQIQNEHPELEDTNKLIPVEEY